MAESVRRADYSVRRCIESNCTPNEVQVVLHWCREIV
jgi:hypothetical protein